MMPASNSKPNGGKTMFTQNKAIMVGDVMIGLNDTPKIAKLTLLKEALEIMDEKKLGIVCIVDDDSQLEGIITDGDIRRMLTKVQKPMAALMSDDVINHAIINPTTVNMNTDLVEAVFIMGNKQIWDLPVVDDNNILKGLLHLHPAIKSMMEA